MNCFRFVRFGWHRSLSAGSRLKKFVYYVLGDPATPTQIRIIPFLLWMRNRQVSNALDIGISHGSLIYYLADQYRNANVYGIDVVDEFIEESRKIKFLSGKVYENVTIINCDIQDPLPSFLPSFDLITMFDVLEHVKNYDACLKNISDKMQQGGILAIGTPYCEDCGFPVQVEKGALHIEHIDHEWKGFSAESMKTILERHGFAIIKDISGFGYFGRFALKMFYFFTIDHSKPYTTDVTPTYNKLPIFFLLFYPLIWVFVCIDAVRKIKNDKTGHCLVIAKKMPISDQCGKYQNAECGRLETTNPRDRRGHNEE